MPTTFVRRPSLYTLPGLHNVSFGVSNLFIRKTSYSETQEKYLDEQSEKRKSVTDIQSQLAQLEYDNSALSEKRKAELKQELADAQKELDDFEKDHALELALDAIDDAYNSQEAQLKREMDALDEKLNDPNALYNQALTDIKNNSKNQLYYTMLMIIPQKPPGKPGKPCKNIVNNANLNGIFRTGCSHFCFTFIQKRG